MLLARKSLQFSACFARPAPVVAPTQIFHNRQKILCTPARHLHATITTSSINKSGIQDQDIQHFKSILGESAVVTCKDQLEVLNTCWLQKWKGSSSVALFPDNAQQISDVLKHCHHRGISVVPQGGNTGLVGGSVPVCNEVILGTKKLNKILEFDAISGVLQCEAGCTLEQLDTWLREQGYIMPLDLGAKGTCQIGGNISTNAGGSRYIRYGSLHGSLLGLEVVLADGSLLNLMSTMKKNNTGYSLKNLFVGAEGTLGVITKVSLAAPKLPLATNVAFLACDTFEDIQKLLVMAKDHLGEILSAAEIIDSKAMEAVKSVIPNIRMPFQTESQFYLLLETQGADAGHDGAKLGALLERAVAGGKVVDGVVAQDSRQAQELWALRENCPVALTHIGYIYKYDLSLPISNFYEVVEVIRKRLQGTDALVVCFGHIGDNNVHLNVVVPEKSDSILHTIEPFVFEWVASKGGSISAEHGVGQHKPSYLGLNNSDVALQKMHAIKQVFDPKGILNPGKFLPIAG